MLLSNLMPTAHLRDKNVKINNLCFNSKVVKKNDIFFAISGVKENGEKFISEAINKGASVIVSKNKINNQIKSKNFVQVKDVRKSLAYACSTFYKKKPKNLLAVTGTNGKTSVAYFFNEILKYNKVKSASIGTLGIKSKGFNQSTPLTTVDPLTLHKTLEKVKKKNVNNVIIEASSHGLDQKRLDYLKFKCGIFTNLSHDHLDYHKSLSSYFKSKLYLFENLLVQGSKIISDSDIKQISILRKIAKKRKLKILTVGFNTRSTITIKEIKTNADFKTILFIFKNKVYKFKTDIRGDFQIKNLLMAFLAANVCGVKVENIIKIIHKIKSPPGRLEKVKKIPFKCEIIVDFAHTPEALETTLTSLRKESDRNISIVFGCGGDRDKKKRSIMGKIANKYCDKIYVTDDNPRFENPKLIRKSIIKNCKFKAKEIPERSKAISTAINEREPNSIILIAGKGHESFQDYGYKKFSVSDQKIVKKIFRKNKINHKYIWHKHLSRKVFKIKNPISFNSISINTKEIAKGDIFFAFKGKKNDGHNFVKDSLKKGAVAAVVERKMNIKKSRKILQVKNVKKSLNDLSRCTRNISDAQFIAITGSSGKTTTKNLIAYLLKNFGKVVKSPKSFNNFLGVPISISNIKDSTNYAVLELGMSRKGEIHKLSKLALPDVGLITNIGQAHLENFKNSKQIARAKSELIDNINKKGFVILNKDDKYFNFLKKCADQKKIKVVSFGLQKGDLFIQKIVKIKNHYKIKISVFNKKIIFKISSIDKIFLINLLASLSVIYVLGLDIEKILKPINNFQIPEGRGNCKKVTINNKLVSLIDHSYNANPKSMSLAIKSFDQLKIKRGNNKIVVLTDMLELGKRSLIFHKAILEQLRQSSINQTILAGELFKKATRTIPKKNNEKVFHKLSEALIYLKKVLNSGDTLMIKGSNATGLNDFAKKLKRKKSVI